MGSSKFCVGVVGTLDASAIGVFDLSVGRMFLYSCFICPCSVGTEGIRCFEISCDVRSGHDVRHHFINFLKKCCFCR